MRYSRKWFSGLSLYLAGVLFILLVPFVARAADSLIRTTAGDLLISTTSGTGGGVLLNTRQTGTGIFINTSNNVGVGTSGPGNRLHVEKSRSDTISSAEAAYRLGGSDVYLFGGSKLSSPYSIWLQAFRPSDDATFPLVLNPNGGNVGVGTVSPSQKLQVNGRIRFLDSGAEIYQNGAGGRLTVRSESVDDVANFASYGLYLPRSGQTAGLYVQSPIEARDGIRMGTGAGGASVWGVTTFNNAVIVPAPSAPNHAATRGYVDTAVGGGVGAGSLNQTLRHSGLGWVASSNLVNDGTNVGIGTSSPSQKLDVAGSAYVDGSVFMAGGGKNSRLFHAYNSASDHSYGSFDISSTGVDTGTREFRFFRNTNSTGQARVTLYKGDGSSTVGAQMSANTGNTYFNVLGGNFGVGTTDPSFSYGGGKFFSVGSLTSNTIGVLEMASDTSTSATVGQIQFSNDNNAVSGTDNTQGRRVALIEGVATTGDNNLGADSGGHLDFYTKPDAGSLTRRIRLNSSGNMELYGHILLQGGSTYSIGGAENNHSGFFDTVDSGGSGDTLELVYYRGTGVTVGPSGGNKWIKASQFIDGNDGSYYVDPNGVSYLNQGIRLAANWPGDDGNWAQVAGSSGHLYLKPASNLSDYVIMRYGSNDRIYWRLNGSQDTSRPSFRTNGNYLVINAGTNDKNLYLNWDVGGNTRVNGALYASDWFRAEGTTGLYSQSHDMHIWPLDGNSNYWGSRSNYGWRYQDRSGNNKGYLYHDNPGSPGGNFGLLASDGAWRVRTYAGGQELYGDTYADYIGFRRIAPRYVGENSGLGTQLYAIYQESGAWNPPYPDLRIAYHTGIKLGANAAYNGIRFYNDYDMTGLVMSVNDRDTSGDNNVYVPNILYVGDTRSNIYYDRNDVGYYVDPNGTSLINVLNTNGQINVGGGSGKVNAGTYDPIYTIGGERYATYLPAMTGVKEETTGVIQLGRSGAPHKLDLRNAPKGSDLWLFAKTTNLSADNFDSVVVLLSPGFDGRVWYEKDATDMAITVYGSEVGEVSYRLTAPRFDSNQWSNRSGELIEGFNLDKLIKTP